MDECCLRAHAKLISGTCPWCGRIVRNGEVIVREARPDAPSIRAIVLSHGPLEPKIAAKYVFFAAADLNSQSSSTPHQNVSPDNIFITASGRLILGPPLQLDNLEVLDNEECVLGTADYLAPEQALNSHKADCRSDIYSLGCTLFFMLTGRPPFEGNSITEVFLKHQTEPPPLVHRINPQVPEPLANICQKMMAKKPADRYQTWLELQTALAIWLD
jgi:serine/threonine protein kinase